MSKVRLRAGKRQSKEDQGKERKEKKGSELVSMQVQTRPKPKRQQQNKQKQATAAAKASPTATASAKRENKRTVPLRCAPGLRAEMRECGTGRDTTLTPTLREAHVAFAESEEQVLNF